MSAYSIREKLEERGRLETPLMYSIKRKGPRIEPCGTPEETITECMEESYRMYGGAVVKSIEIIVTAACAFNSFFLLLVFTIISIL